MIHGIKGTSDQSEPSFWCLLLHTISALVSVKYVIQRTGSFGKEREASYVIVAPGSAVIWLVTNTATLYSAIENNAKRVDQIQF